MPTLKNIIEAVIEELQRTQDATILHDYREQLQEVYWSHAPHEDPDSEDQLICGILNPLTGTLGRVYIDDRTRGQIAFDEGLTTAVTMLRRHLLLMDDAECDDQVVLSTPEARLIDLLLTEGDMSLAGLAEFLKCSERTVQRSAKRPIDLGYIVKNAGRYAATKKARDLSL